MEVVPVVIAQQTVTAFSDNFNNKFTEFMEEKFYDNVMHESKVKEAFKYMCGEPVLNHINDTFRNTLTIRLIINMQPKDATYWKLKHQ